MPKAANLIAELGRYLLCALCPGKKFVSVLRFFHWPHTLHQALMAIKQDEERKKKKNADGRVGVPQSIHTYRFSFLPAYIDIFSELFISKVLLEK